MPARRSSGYLQVRGAWIVRLRLHLSSEGGAEELERIAGLTEGLCLRLGRLESRPIST